MRIAWFHLAVATFLLAADLAAAPDDVRVIVHPGNPVEALTRDEVTRLFLHKKTAWPDGRAAIAVDQPEASPVREAFAREVLRRSPAAVVAYWQQQVFAGRDVPPPERAGDGDVVDFVRTHEGAIGYVGGAATLSGVKVVNLKD